MTKAQYAKQLLLARRYKEAPNQRERNRAEVRARLYTFKLSGDPVPKALRTRARRLNVRTPRG